MKALIVGEPLEENKRKYAEGLIFDTGKSGAKLLIFFNSPTSKEIDSVKNADIELRLCVLNDIIFILSKVGTNPWMDSPYSVHLAKYKLEDLPETEQLNSGYGLPIILIDANTGIVKVIRYIGLSTEFSQKLNQEINKQYSLPFSEGKYHMSLNRIFNNYNTKDLLKYSIARYKSKKN